MSLVIAYDPSRKLNKNQKRSVAKNASGDEKKIIHSILSCAL